MFLVTPEEGIDYSSVNQLSKKNRLNMMYLSV